MLSGNSYTFVHIEKHNAAHLKSKSKSKPETCTKSTLKRSNSRSRNLNLYQETKENRENKEEVILDDKFKNYFSLEMWDAEW
jgi:hypothetical protein